MSRVFVVFAHPSHKSFNHALLEALTEGLRAGGHGVEISDLYAQRFDPAMTAGEIYRSSLPDEVVREQEKVSWAETLIVVYPVWWWGPPAILKGWLERVLCLGYAFRYDIAVNGYAGLLSGRQAVVVSTGSADPQTYPHRWMAEAQEQLVPEILRTAGIDVVRQISLSEIHQYAPPNILEQAIHTIGAFASTL